MLQSSKGGNKLQTWCNEKAPSELHLKISLHTLYYAERRNNIRKCNKWALTRSANRVQTHHYFQFHTMLYIFCKRARQCMILYRFCNMRLFNVADFIFIFPSHNIHVFFSWFWRLNFSLWCNFLNLAQRPTCYDTCLYSLTHYINITDVDLSTTSKNIWSKNLCLRFQKTYNII